MPKGHRAAQRRYSIPVVLPTDAKESESGSQFRQQGNEMRGRMAPHHRVLGVSKRVALAPCKGGILEELVSHRLWEDLGDELALALLLTPQQLLPLLRALYGLALLDLDHLREGERGQKRERQRGGGDLPSCCSNAPGSWNLRSGKAHK